MRWVSCDRQLPPRGIAVEIKICEAYGENLIRMRAYRGEDGLWRGLAPEYPPTFLLRGVMEWRALP